jgi:hypothetical protein
LQHETGLLSELWILKKMKINGFYLFVLLFLACIVAWSLYPPFRYLKYFLPVVALIIIYKNPNATFTTKGKSNYFTTFLVLYSAIIGYLLIKNILLGELSARFIPNAAFMVAPLVFVAIIVPYFRKEKIHQYVIAMLLVNMLVFFYEEGGDFLSVITDLQILKNAIIDSTVPTENHLAFAFGFFVLFFFIERYNRVYQFLAFVIFILCFKRIVIAAVLFCLATYYFLSFFRIDVARYRKTLTLVGVVVNIGFVYFTHLLVSGTFDEVVHEKTGISTDQFLMGRKTFYTEAFEKAGAINWTGLGLGKMDDVIFQFYGSWMNLHSEVLKNYFEFGVIIFVVWLFIFFYKNLFSNKAAIFFLYANILMLTDNVFIYFDVMFYFYFFILIYLFEREEMRQRLVQQ